MVLKVFFFMLCTDLAVELVWGKIMPIVKLRLFDVTIVPIKLYSCKKIDLINFQIYFIIKKENPISYIPLKCL